ncbi:MAG TPA: alpha amylase C-terminal domain-containing protein, partial [Verrucomicrobiae bacterium]|nr:alpha amylase C-terminal domain-containing protein [Verrucomicrobiae bacterium]
RPAVGRPKNIYNRRFWAQVPNLADLMPSAQHWRNAGTDASPFWDRLYLVPGKKLLFMGAEFAQWESWHSDASLDWHLLAFPFQSGVLRLVGDLNCLYRREQALHRSDSLPVGFEWVEPHDAEQSTLSWLRRDPQRREVLLVVANFTPVVRRNFRVGVRRSGSWREILNSDAKEYGGSGQGNFGGLNTSPFSSHGLPYTLSLTLPPLALLVFKHED